MLALHLHIPYLTSPKNKDIDVYNYNTIMHIRVFLYLQYYLMLLSPQSLHVQSNIGLESGKGRCTLLVNSAPISQRQRYDYTAAFAFRLGQGI